MRDATTAVVVALVFGLLGAVLAWLMRHPIAEPLTLPCSESCGSGWRGVEFRGGCACVQELSP